VRAGRSALELASPTASFWLNLSSKLAAALVLLALLLPLRWSSTLLAASQPG
jgi:hypothetical protein